MGYTRKNTPERLDKLVQFIYHYQQQHAGETPSRSVIANNTDIPADSVSWFIKLLVDDNRLERISNKPWRVRLLEHPKNRAAIRRLEKALAAATEAEQAAAANVPADEPLEAPPVATSDAAPVPPTPAPAENYPPQHGMNWNEAATIIARHGGDLDLIASTFIIRTAKNGDLLAELIDRGYTVSKTR